MEPTETYKIFGVLAAALTTIAAAYVLFTAEKVQRHRSISMHVAERRVTYLLFAATSFISATLFSLFLLRWFIPALQLPFVFTATIFIAIGAQLVAALVPHTTGWKAATHNVMAYIMAIALMATVPALLLAPELGVLPKVFIGVIFAWMAGSFTSLFVTPQVRRHFLPLQIAFLASFFAAIFIATFAV